MLAADERRRSFSTENVAGVIGFACALALADDRTNECKRVSPRDRQELLWCRVPADDCLK